MMASHRLTVTSVSLVALSILSMVGCVYPASTTYYEAVDKPWIASSTEGNLASCPSTDYREQFLGRIRVWVIPSFHERTSQIRVNVAVPHEDPLTFQTWSVRLTSLTDNHAQSSIPLRFYAHCLERNIDSCPKISAEPNIQHGSTTASTDRVTNFVGITDIPPEFVGGFILELQDTSNGQILDLKPQRFELRKKMLLRGTFGCG
jgi:hypothetical protein